MVISTERKRPSELWMNVMDGCLFREVFSGEGESERCLGVQQPREGRDFENLAGR